MTTPHRLPNLRRCSGRVWPFLLVALAASSCQSHGGAKRDAGPADGHPARPETSTPADLAEAAAPTDGPASKDGASDLVVPARSDGGAGTIDSEILVADASTRETAADASVAMADAPDSARERPSQQGEVPPWLTDAADGPAEDARVYPAVDLGPAPDGNPDPRWRVVASSVTHSCAVRRDHTLWCWGDNTMGQLGDGTTETQTSPTQVAGENWASVAVGELYTCGLDTSGGVRCWGDNQKHELGSASGCQSVFTGGNTTCVLRAGGSLACWGDNEYGQVGVGSSTAVASAATIPGTWSTVAIGARHVCAIQADSTLWCWGWNGSGQLGLGVGAGQQKNAPVQVEGTGWTSVGCGPVSTCAIKNDGTLWCWGQNSSGQLGDGTSGARSAPGQVPGSGWQSVVMGGTWFADGHACAIKSDGTLWCWGYNRYGQLGIGSTAKQTTPAQVTGRWTHVAAGKIATCGIDLDGGLLCWGGNGIGTLGIGFAATRLTPTQIPGEGWISVAASGIGDSSERHVCGTRTDGSLWCWGENTWGQLGDGTTQTSTVPVAIGGNDWAQVAVSQDFNCAVKTDATLWCWGKNDRRQIAYTADSRFTVPTQVPGTSWASASVGSSHACARQTDNTLWCWGDYNRVTQVSGSDWASVSAGSGYTCATKTDGTLWCWGLANSDGQLGLGTKTAVESPTRVAGTSYLQVAAGKMGTGALRSDGSIWSWGHYTYDTKGLMLNSSSSPVQGTGTDWIRISVGGSNSCGIRADSSLWCWGSQESGAVGDGVDHNNIFGLPSQVAGTDWTSVSVGDRYVCALRGDRTLWCWGANGNGMLGESYAWRNVPTPVKE